MMMNTNSEASTSDVLIIGGGPAGLWCGLLLLRKGYQVTILESCIQRKRKICGEYLAPAGVEILKQHAVDTILLKDFYPLHGMKIYTSHSPPVMGTFSRPGCSLKRDIFDERLKDLFVKEGGIFHYGKPLKHLCHLLNDQWSVETKNGEHFLSPYLIGADGKMSKVSRLLHIDQKPWPHQKERVAFHTFWKKKSFDDLQFVKEEQRFGEMHLFTHGHYVGLNPIDAHEWNVTFVLDRKYLKDKRPEELMTFYLSQSPRLNQIYQDWSEHLPFVSTYPLFHYVTQRSDKDWALVGDAAHFSDPLTGEGIFGALKSATLLSEEFPHKSKNQVNLLTYGETYRKHFLQKQRLNGLFQFVLYHSLCQYVIARLLLRKPEYQSMFMDIIGNLQSPLKGLYRLFTLKRGRP
jgi:flavin-dependent dehydrogenase